ncbi:hypothetical protein BJ987_005345 [Nocardia goodfellowii]|uniref:Secreted protein n=1 Tax=Nocardia goodfellowii TaxID=882446 RepID=A0ABS4QN35_9NOCA|nr:hypothetical protein [Nocardia goodfellowii]
MAGIGLLAAGAIAVAPAAYGADHAYYECDNISSTGTENADVLGSDCKAGAGSPKKKKPEGPGIIASSKDSRTAYICREVAPDVPKTVLGTDCKLESNLLL